MFDLPHLVDPEERIHRRLARLTSIRGAGRPTPAHPDLSPEEQKSVLREALNAGVGGLQYLGETLDKPGRAVRGLLAGKPEELANLIPFSDTMGITDPSNGVSGKQLLQTHGFQDTLTPEQEDKLGIMERLGRGAAGFGAEVLTDPLTYLTFGGSALMGQGGKKAAAFGLKLPGVGKTFIPEIARHPAALKAAELPGKALMSIPGMEALNRGRRALFDYRVKGQVSKAGQALAEAQTGALESMRPEALKPWANLAGDIDEIGRAYSQSFGNNPLPPDLASSFEKLARMHTEGVQSQKAFQHFNLPFHPETSQKLAAATSEFAAAKNKLWQQALDMGLDADSMAEVADMLHAPRYARDLKPGALPDTYRGTPSSVKHRVLPTKHLPTDVVNQMLNDPDIAAGLKAGSVKPVLNQKYGQWLGPAAQATGKSPTEVLDDLAQHLGSRKKLIELFQNNPGDLYGRFTPDTYKYMSEMSRKVANMGAIHEAAHANLVPGGVDLPTLFKDAGMNPEAATMHFVKRFGPAGQGMGVAPDVANAILSVTKKSESAPWLKETLRHVDNLTKMFKGNVTLPFPAFAVRNLFSGQWMNIASNEIPDFAHLKAYGGATKEAMDVLKSPGKYRNLIDELAAHRVYDEADIAALGTELGMSMRRTPNPVTLGGMFKQNVASGLQSARERGFGLEPGLLSGTKLANTKAAKKFVQGMATPMQVGAEFNRQVEFMNRVPMYLYLRKKVGWSAEQAAAKVRELQVDYSALAPFEKQVMKRLVPFYTYTRKIVPAMLSQIAHRPGGVTAQTLRASNIGRSESEFVPPYVGEGMSVKLGPDQYLSQLGLPTDQFSDLFAKGPTALGTIKRTGQKLLSMTNPIVKGPLETISGQNFFTGRPIEQSFQYPTPNVLANQILHNTPFSRAITTVRQIGDERKSPFTKAANLTTGLRITDLSGGLDRQQRIAEGQILAEMLRESPHISSYADVYPRKDRDTGKPMPLTAEEERLYRAYLGIKKAAQKEAKKKRNSPAPSTGAQ